MLVTSAQDIVKNVDADSVIIKIINNDTLYIPNELLQQISHLTSSSGFDTTDKLGIVTIIVLIAVPIWTFFQQKKQFNQQIETIKNQIRIQKKQFKTQLDMQKQHLIKSVTPKGNIKISYASNLFKIILNNIGIGPLHVKNIKVLKSGKEIDDLWKIIPQVPANSATTHIKNDIIAVGDSYLGLKAGEGEPILAFEDIRDSEIGREFIEKLRGLFKDVSILVYYSDIYKSEEFVTGVDLNKLSGY